MDRLQECKELFRKASGHMAVIERQNLNHPEIIVSCQQAVQLYVQIICKLLHIDIACSHEDLLQLSREGRRQRMQQMIERIDDSQLPALYPYKDQVPKAIFLVFFWSGLREYAEDFLGYLQARPKALFGREEVQLALAQSRLCHKMAKSLLDLQS